MTINPSIFKSYDIRAIYPTQINEENIEIIAQSIYKVISKKINKEKFSFAIGRDMRLSGPSLYEHLKKALLSCGLEIIDFGLISTPTFYYGVYANKYDAGVQLSASHNPKNHNGLKIVVNSPAGLIKIGKNTGMDEIKNDALGFGSFLNVSGGKISEKKDILENEVKNALKLAKNPKLNQFRVVADAANAMGALYIDELFKYIPGELIRMNFELDGTFPVHQPDPLNFETLIDLQKKVLEEKADIGFAPDGDGDRFFFIDEKGQIVTPSIITSLVAREILKTHPGAMILFDIRYILGPSKIIQENSGKFAITKVGHAFITEAMHETGAIFAGESSSHFFFKETGNGEAPIPVILTVLAVMTRENKKLSEIVQELRRSWESGEFNFEVINAAEIIESLKQKYSDGKLDEMDGIAITYPNWRFSLRSSNTEPLLRLNVEAYDKSVMEEKRDELKSEIEKLKA
ncbi:MAG: hypothetical protein A3A51_04950 [Candidatus Levybacteria bacterium RIFCSPLOWO2_01_FULL_39_10]|nr:MAG: hypothetical protein A3A51_04950 [Candidatus Levybacteria bacterium RIFCSPLOWO2_01_FULL_39_10]